MPVFWSPSSRTALAEAELEYQHDHKSTSVYLALRLATLSPGLASLLAGLKEQGQGQEKGQEQEVEQGQEVDCLVWTTTPWSLAANRAVCYHPNLEYSLVRSPARYSIAFEAL